MKLLWLTTGLAGWPCTRERWICLLGKCLKGRQWPAGSSASSGWSFLKSNGWLKLESCDNQTQFLHAHQTKNWLETQSRSNTPTTHHTTVLGAGSLLTGAGGQTCPPSLQSFPRSLQFSNSNARQSSSALKAGAEGRLRRGRMFSPCSVSSAFPWPQRPEIAVQ